MYPANRYEVRIARRADLNSVADVTAATWAPGLFPHVIHAVGAVIDNAIGGAGVVKFDIRPTFGSDTDRGNGDAGVLNIPNGQAGGTVVYKFLSSRVVVLPGQEVVAEVTDATAASDTADLILLVEPVYENPRNNADMTESA